MFVAPVMRKDALISLLGERRWHSSFTAIENASLAVSIVNSTHSCLNIQVVQRALYAAEGFAGHVRINLSRLAAAVPKQVLNVTQVCAIFHQVRGKAVPQCVHGGVLLYISPQQGLFNYGLHAALAILPSALAFKKEFLRAVLLIIIPQQWKHFFSQ